MRCWPLNTCLLSLCFFIYSSALPRSKDFGDFSSEFVPGESSFVTDLSKEPTCDELRAMWRFSKRQSRAAEISNEIPTYRDPFAFNIWEGYDSPRSVGRNRYRKPIYGRLVHTTPRYTEKSPARVRAFEEVPKLYMPSSQSPLPTQGRKTSFRFSGGANPLNYVQMNPRRTSGGFQHLKELIRNERARELQEQRINEENERNNAFNNFARMSNNYGRINNGPQMPNMNGNIVYKEKPSSVHKALVPYPDIMVPGAYNFMDDYTFLPAQMPMHKYKERTADNPEMSNPSQWQW